MDSSAPPPPGPAEVHDPVVRDAFKQAAVWLGLGAALFLAWQLRQPLLLIVGAIVFAALLDAGTRLLGRVLPWGRPVRLTIVILFIVALILGFLAIAGIQIVEQAGDLRATLDAQIQKLARFLEQFGIASVSGNEGRGPLAGIATQLVGSLGQLTKLLGNAAGAVGGFVLMLVLGAFIAAEPRLYERGAEWLTPVRARAQVRDTLEHIAATLRRWVGGRLFAMFCDGLLTAIGLAIVGVPYAALLGLIAGALAFIPNVGAAIAGALMVLVGFSVDSTTGFWAIGVYLTVQFVEGNLLTPFVERRVVDLAPAVVLGAQLLFGTLFGIVGVALADPIVAMIKVALERSRAAKAPQSRGTHAAWPTSNVSPVSPQPS